MRYTIPAALAAGQDPAPPLHTRCDGCKQRGPALTEERSKGKYWKEKSGAEVNKEGEVEDEEKEQQGLHKSRENR